MQTRIMLLALSLMLTACTDSGDRSAEAEQDTVTQTDAHAAPADSAHAHEGEAEAAPLLAIMQKLGAEMTGLTYGLMTDSAQLISKSAHAIAEHANIADIQTIQNTLGSEFVQFERLDMDVHEASVRLAQAAESGNRDEVLAILSEVQRGCMACHTQFRERLRADRLRTQ